MLCVDPYNRIPADQALQHKWIKLHDKSDQDFEVTRKALIALSKYNTTAKL